MNKTTYFAIIATVFSMLLGILLIRNGVLFDQINALQMQLAVCRDGAIEVRK
jgi:hypothetical protein